MPAEQTSAWFCAISQQALCSNSAAPKLLEVYKQLWFTEFIFWGKQRHKSNPEFYAKKSSGRKCADVIDQYNPERFLIMFVISSAFVWVQEKTKPAVENSLRILTAVIDGMRHWSRFKDRVPYLFEIFGQLMGSWCGPDVYYMKLTWCVFPSATLDSAVTLGQHGAKNFLMRDGKETVQCVFYENVSYGEIKVVKTNLYNYISCL